MSLFHRSSIIFPPEHPFSSVRAAQVRFTIEALTGWRRIQCIQALTDATEGASLPGLSLAAR